ncbi:MAG: thermonuclease family protein [Janthinobacterium lividum]
MNAKQHFLVGSGLALLAALGGASGALKPGPLPEAARVARVVDADTYDVVAGGRRVRMRLLGVDAPEHDQAFGAQATDSMAALLPVGRLVQLRRHGVDLYGRTLGSLTLPAAGALDSLLVVRGWAWAYDPAHAVAGRAAQQAQAQAAGRGLWKCGAAGAVPPKVWRGLNYKNKRRYGAGCSW